MLTEIYDWFTERFDTVDLKDAKALLDELSRVIFDIASAFDTGSGRRPIDW